MRKVINSLIATILTYVIMFCASPTMANAATYYVAGDVGDDTRTTAQAQLTTTPWKTIQKAADTMVAGDIVNVKGGLTYSTTKTCGSHVSIVCLTRSGSANNYIIYQSWEGTGIPILDGASNKAGFVVSSTNLGVNYNKIAGFIVKDTSYGIIVSGNSNIIANNIVYDQEPILYSIGVYAGLSEASVTYVLNNTVSGKYNGVALGSGRSFIENNIIYSSTNFGIAGQNIGTSYVESFIDYNDVYNSGIKDYAVGLLEKGIHNLSVDPMFVDSDNYDFTISSQSELVDAGAIKEQVVKDIAYNDRLLGSGQDIGAYESNFTLSTHNYNVLPNSSPTSAKSLTLLGIFTGESIGDQFAYPNQEQPLDVADVNEDGFDDVIVGARYHVPSGGVYIFKGGASISNKLAVNADIILRDDEDTNPGDSGFGGTLSTGDLDNDGHLELLVSNYRHDVVHHNEGAAYIFKLGPDFSSRGVSDSEARTVGLLERHSLSDPARILGDINGDGYDDYLLTGLVNDYRFHIYFGEPILTNKTIEDTDITITDSSFKCIFSHNIPKGADFNNDGYQDILFGCANGGDDYFGSIYLFYGSDNLQDMDITDADVIISSAVDTYAFGGVISAGDINNDGYQDILTNSSDKAFIFYGSSNWTNRSVTDADVTFVSDSDFPECSELTYSSIANINNDDYLDVVISNSCLARSYVMYGSSNLINKSVKQADLVYTGLWGSHFGDPLSFGDINNDGYTDIVAGAGTYNQRQGRVYVFTSPHGLPVFAINNGGKVGSAGLLVNITDTVEIGGVEASFDNGAWVACTLHSGAFICPVTSLSDGSHTVRIRSYTSLGVYIPTTQYVNSTFVLDKTITETTRPVLGLIIDNPNINTDVDIPIDNPTVNDDVDSDDDDITDGEIELVDEKDENSHNNTIYYLLGIGAITSASILGYFYFKRG